MNWADMGWGEISIFLLGGSLVAGGVIGFIAGLRHEWKSKQRSLRPPDHAVGRDCFTDRQGIWK